MAFISGQLWFPVFLSVWTMNELRRLETTGIEGRAHSIISFVTVIMFPYSSCSHARSTALLCCLSMAYESAGVISWPFSPFSLCYVIIDGAPMNPLHTLLSIILLIFSNISFYLLKIANVWALVIFTCWWWWKLQYIMYRTQYSFSSRQQTSIILNRTLKRQDENLEI